MCRPTAPIPEQVVNIDTALARNPDAIITVDRGQRRLRRGHPARPRFGCHRDRVQRGRPGRRGGQRAAGLRGPGLRAGRQLACRPRSRSSSRAEGPIHVAVGVSAPGQNWSEQRAQGIIEGLEAWAAAANPDREFSLRADRLRHRPRHRVGPRGAYLSANPNTNAYLDTGFWHAGVARVLRPGHAGGRGPARRLRPRARGARPDVERLRPGAGGPAALHAGLPAGHAWSTCRRTSA
jgi:simple sugar transport system substrate-binding protein